MEDDDLMCRPPGPSCSICGSDMYWDECDYCGGEGYREVCEEDPLWYDDDETETCDWCHGKGGHWFCLNFKNHPETAAPQVAP